MKKPVYSFLPPFGYCEFEENFRDIRDTYISKHKVICEVSSHIYYQYIFLFTWYAMVFGIVISVVSFFWQLFVYLVLRYGVMQTAAVRFVESFYLKMFFFCSL